MMTQQNNTTNWVLQDANGQPQMFKLVQSAGKSIGGIMTSTITGQQVKLYKSPISNQDTAQTFTTTGSQPQQILKTITGTPKLVTTKALPLPVGVSIARGSTRTIRLTPAQVVSSKGQNLKVINTQKIQFTQAPITTTSVSAAIIPQTTTAASVNQTQKSYTSPPILDHSGSRKRQEVLDSEFAPESKRNRKTEKVGKGLRHFSMKVCEKVRKKGTTSYNEVADELVGEFTNSALNSSLADQYDQKNIRRRVYDALNVLMAMNIISKEKKEIRWIGLPTNSLQECIQLEKEKQKKIESIKVKTKQLSELLMNQIAFKNLAQRNKQIEELQGPPPPNSFIQLPFIVVNTNKKTIIDCSITNDKMEYMFQFNDKFEINDDVEILKSIGMLMGLDKGECSPENLEKIKSMVPKALEDYVIQLANGDGDNLDQILESAGPGPSNMTFVNAEDLVETQLDEENSRQSSSFDPLSPSAHEFSDDEGDTDISSDGELN